MPSIQIWLSGEMEVRMGGNTNPLQKYCVFRAEKVITQEIHKKIALHSESPVG
jgi:hypothetical protein